MAPYTDRNSRIRQSLRLAGFTETREYASRAQWMAHCVDDMDRDTMNVHFDIGRIHG